MSDYLKKLWFHLNEPASPSDLRWWGACGTLVALILALMLVATRPASYHVPKNEHAEQTRKVERVPRAADRLIGSTGEVQAKANQHESSNRKKGPLQDASVFDWVTDKFLEFKLTDWLLVIFTAILAYKTAGLFRETAGLKAATDKLWEAGERQIEIAKTAADAATAASQTADRGLRITQRAYIGVEPDGIRPHRRKREGAPVGGPTDVTGHFFVVNCGHLPARDLSWFVDITCEESRLWKPPTDFESSKFVGNDMVVTPGTRMRRATGVIRTTEFMLMDGAKSMFCYVWGQVRYRDGLDDTIRTTNFCHRYNCEALRQDNTVAEEHARYHESGNDGT